MPRSLCIYLRFGFLKSHWFDWTNLRTLSKLCLIISFHSPMPLEEEVSWFASCMSESKITIEICNAHAFFVGKELHKRWQFLKLSEVGTLMTSLSIIIAFSKRHYTAPHQIALLVWAVWYLFSVGVVGLLIGTIIDFENPESPSTIVFSVFPLSNC